MSMTPPSPAVTKVYDHPEDFWSRRYTDEGHIWGDNPSMVANIATSRHLSRHASVFDVGCGYGRDLAEYVGQGLRATGIETSHVAFQMAAGDPKITMSGNGHLILGDFTTAPLQRSEFDAVTSHRTLHLLKGTLVRAFVNRAAEVLKPEGLLIVSARDERDFNPDQMIRRSDGSAEYKDRPGHIIHFWNQQRFRDTFGDKFEIIEFRQGEEIESEKNPVPSYFTVMVARKKANPAPDICK